MGPVKVKHYDTWAFQKSEPNDHEPTDELGKLTFFCSVSSNSPIHLMKEASRNIAFLSKKKLQYELKKIESDRKSCSAHFSVLLFLQSMIL